MPWSNKSTNIRTKWGCVFSLTLGIDTLHWTWPTSPKHISNKHVFHPSSWRDVSSKLGKPLEDEFLSSLQFGHVHASSSMYHFPKNQLGHSKQERFGYVFFSQGLYRDLQFPLDFGDRMILRVPWVLEKTKHNIITSLNMSPILWWNIFTNFTVSWSPRSQSNNVQ